MKSNITARVSTNIDSPVSKVWEALTKPELIRQYFFGTQASSDWKEGSPITFKGEWEGKKYEDKGTILDIEPNKTLTLYSSHPLQNYFYQPWLPPYS